MIGGQLKGLEFTSNIIYNAMTYVTNITTLQVNLSFYGPPGLISHNTARLIINLREKKYFLSYCQTKYRISNKLMLLF